MTQIWITRAGDERVLELREAPDPRPGPGEVLIDVRAVGVNFADIMARMGMYSDAPPIPCVVGYEVTGIVTDIGIGVSDVAPNDHVLAITHFGGYATRVCVPQEQVLPLPRNTDFPIGAALAVSYLTAWLALFTMGNLRKGERVLIHSAGGGVGLAAVQLAATAGAEIYGTSSAHKHDVLRSSGVLHLVDPSATPFDEEILRVTLGKGVDLILDSAGGRSIRLDRRILAPMGRIVAYGISSSARTRRRSISGLIRMALSTPRFSLFDLMNSNSGVLGLNLGHLWGEIDQLRRVLLQIVELFEKGTIAPRVDRVFAFEEVGAAHRYLQDRRNIGKVVLAVDDPDR